MTDFQTSLFVLLSMVNYLLIPAFLVGVFVFVSKLRPVETSTESRNKASIYGFFAGKELPDQALWYACLLPIVALLVCLFETWALWPLINGFPRWALSLFFGTPSVALMLSSLVFWRYAATRNSRPSRIAFRTGALLALLGVAASVALAQRALISVGGSKSSPSQFVEEAQESAKSSRSETGTPSQAGVESDTKSQEFSKIPVIAFQVSERAIDLSQLGKKSAFEIEANVGLALISDGRTVWQLRAGNGELEEIAPGALRHKDDWYQPVCPWKDGFAIGVSTYPDAQIAKEGSKNRGDFVAGPKPRGFLVVSPSTQDIHSRKLTVRSRPPLEPGVAEARGKEFYWPVQSCALDGGRLAVGAMGALGWADLDKGVVDLIDEDDGLEFNRAPILAERGVLWIGVDDGGSFGAWIARWPPNGPPANFEITNGQDVISPTAFVRHDDRLIVGTTHGLFSLDRETGAFIRFDFGPSLDRKPVTDLVSHEGSLYAFIGNQWLRIDTQNRQAAHLVAPDNREFYKGRFFDGHWIALGPNGIWRVAAIK